MVVAGAVALRLLWPAIMVVVVVVAVMALAQAEGKLNLLLVAIPLHTDTGTQVGQVLLNPIGVLNHIILITSEQA